MLQQEYYKQHLKWFAGRFLQVINDSSQYGTFPKNWKQSTVIPTEKNTNTNKCKKFRLINMVPIYKKLLEKVVDDQFRNFYFGNNSLLSKYQTRFSQGW